MSCIPVVIVGAGPAGISCAIQLKRYGVPFKLIEKDAIGGLLRNANFVENYPGFPNGVNGVKLAGLLERQMQRIGVEVTQDEVSGVGRQLSGQWQVDAQHDTYTCDYLVVATGTDPNPYPVPISEQTKLRISNVVIPFLSFNNKNFVIVGAGDAAFDYALNLSKKRNNVTILNRGRDVKCLPLLQERASLVERIEYRDQSPVSGVDVDESGVRLRVRIEQSGRDQVLECDYLIFATGRVPALDILPKEKIDHPRLFLIGDVKNGLYRQAAIAAGDGLRAAMEIYAKLEER